MAMTASKLRADIYRLLDQVLESGQPLKIERNGRTLTILPDAPRSGIEAIPVDPDLIVGDPEDLVEIDWSGEWKPYV